MLDLLPRPLPFLTAHLPGLGGIIKVLPEDFTVEELPDEALSGEGEHLYLWVEKRGRDTPEVANDLARAFSVPSCDVGYAGLKDRQAVARQWFSIPTATEVPVDIPGVHVLASSRHSRKLRTGALRGNRFRILLRGVRDPAGVRPLLDAMLSSGVPNWFGPQRFGRRGDNAVLGAALIGAGEHPLAGRAQRDAFLRRMTLSALQSELFNRLLADRVREGRLGALEVGDVVEIPEDPRPLLTRDDSLAPRVAGFEAAVTGPMFGSRMLVAQGAPGEREQRTLAAAGLSQGLFERGGSELRGTRRPYRFKLGAVELRPEPDALALSFDLPAGGYATSILRELTRDSPTHEPEGDGELK